MNKRVLVAGATGYLGRYLVKELKRKGYWVRVLVRKEEQKELFDEVDDYYVGQITNPSTLNGVANGIDWVVSTIGITRQKDGLTYIDVDFQGNANLLAEALKSGVEAFQYISAINGDKLRNLKIFEAKERFVDLLKASELRYIIVRPNGFFSDMRDFLEMAKRGRVYLFGNGQLRLNPIDGEDLAQFCVEHLESSEGEFPVGGPDILSHQDLATLALQSLGKPLKITYLPDWTRKLTILLLRTFTSARFYGPYEFFLSAMAFDNIATQYGKKHLAEFYQSESPIGCK